MVVKMVKITVSEFNNLAPVLPIADVTGVERKVYKTH